MAKPFFSLAIRAMAVMALFCMAAVVAAGAPPGGGKQSGWVENFAGPALNPNFWVIANGQAPGRIFGSHLGLFQPDRVSVEGGYLVLRLTQEHGLVDGAMGVISRGGMISTLQTYGKGVYQMRMRMSSDDSTPDPSLANAVSGSVSAGFVYVNNSKTEIDVESQGLDPDAIYFVNWKNTNPNSPPMSSESTLTRLPLFGLTDGFITYKFVWKKNSVEYYVDGALRAVHTTDVPTSPAYFMLTHWGSNSPFWGGLATPGVTRYFYVDWVKYTPE